MIKSSFPAEPEKAFSFLALALRQRLIKRWSLMYSVHEESVLEHSAVVTLLALMAGHIASQSGRPIDMGKLLSHAALHDVAEVLCSDVVTPVKKASPKLAEEFARLEQAAEARLLETLPEALRGPIEQAFAPGGYEQDLVKACDVYAAYIKCRIEVASGNGLEFGEALTVQQRKVEALRAEFEEIRAIDDWFGASFGASVDLLLKPLMPEA